MTVSADTSRETERRPQPTATSARAVVPAQPTGQRPNILFFHVDNTGVGDWGAYGGAYALGAKTPNVDRFADEGLLLQNYAPEAQCTPTRSALMTGRHPIRTGCINALGEAGLVAWEVTIAAKLKELGYSNACLGKWHCGDQVGRLPTDHGFDYWYGPPRTWDEAQLGSRPSSLKNLSSGHSLTSWNPNQRAICGT